MTPIRSDLSHDRMKNLLFFASNFICHQHHNMSHHFFFSRNFVSIADFDCRHRISQSVADTGQVACIVGELGALRNISSFSFAVHSFFILTPSKNDLIPHYCTFSFMKNSHKPKKFNKTHWFGGGLYHHLGFTGFDDGSIEIKEYLNAPPYLTSVWSFSLGQTSDEGATPLLTFFQIAISSAKLS